MSDMDNEMGRPVPQWQFGTAQGPVNWRALEHDETAWRKAEEAMLRWVRGDFE